MGEGVDAECGLLDEEDAENACVDEAAEPVTPTYASHNHGENETHEKDDFQVVLVLPYYDGILVQIADVGTTDAFWVLFHQHPAKVAVE